MQLTAPVAGAERRRHATPGSLEHDEAVAGATVSGAASASTSGATSGVDPRLALLETQMKKVRYRDDALIEVLHAVQDIYGYLAPAVLKRVADGLQLPPSRVMGVATFYHLFTFEARGDHTCTVCTGTACFVKGADALMAGVQRAFAVEPGSTRSDGALSLLEARCIGSCGLAPVALVDGAVVAKATSEGLHARVRIALEAAPAGARAGGVT
jgi:bidirectional [NiFe] hydrogenase diaphorase subunit